MPNSTILCIITGVDDWEVCIAPAIAAPALFSASTNASARFAGRFAGVVLNMGKHGMLSLSAVLTRLIQKPKQIN